MAGVSRHIARAPGATNHSLWAPGALCDNSQHTRIVAKRTLARQSPRAFHAQAALSEVLAVVAASTVTRST